MSDTHLTEGASAALDALRPAAVRKLEADVAIISQVLLRYSADSDFLRNSNLPIAIASWCNLPERLWEDTYGEDIPDRIRGFVASHSGARGYDCEAVLEILNDTTVLDLLRSCRS